MRPNKAEWIIFIYLFILLTCGLYMQGYCMGKRSVIQITPQAVKFLQEKRILEIDPNTDPKYKDLREQGLKWVEGKGWTKE